MIERAITAWEGKHPGAAVVVCLQAELHAPSYTGESALIGWPFEFSSEQ